jgi:hypothetical protein
VSIKKKSLDSKKTAAKGKSTKGKVDTNKPAASKVVAMSKLHFGTGSGAGK